MMRSLSSAVAGLRSHQTKMDVIGNNIANVNTYGFKASRATFADVYYQNLSGGSAANGSVSGGTNPTQIGYGASIATIDILNTQSGSASTDRAMDVYITGDGFLVSKDPSGNFQYSRLGNLGFDASGNLVDGNGNIVYGFPQNPDGSPKISANGTVTGSELVGIRVDPDLLDRLTGISISTTGAIIGLLPGDSTLKVATALPTWMNSDQISITSNSTYSGAVRLAVSGCTDKDTFNTAMGTNSNLRVTNIEMGTIALNVTDDYKLNVDTNGKVTLTYKGTPAVSLSGYLKDGKVVLTDSNNNVGLTLTVDPSVTKLDETTTDATLKLEYYMQMITTDKGGNKVVEPSAGPQKFTGGTVQFGDLSVQFSGAPNEAFNGNIGTATTAEGEKIHIGNLVLAKFRNNQGLQQAGSSYYEETFNSGEAIFVKPGIEGTGSLKAGYLEMSNVDVAKEFTDMITTQRGFQANTRIITVSDEMLQELVNLKR